MENRILADNWTFQNAGEFLQSGLRGDTARELTITKKGEAFEYRKINADVLRFDALCQLINALVLYDRVFIEGDYVQTWDSFDRLKDVKGSTIVVPKPFTDLKDEWLELREATGDALCVNQSLLTAHRKNKRDYSKKAEEFDPFLSQLIWGGSGMLARAAYFDLAYMPHPLRESLIRRAGFMGRPNASDRFKSFVSKERLKISQTTDGDGFVGFLDLPPIVCQVICESDSPDQLISTALQLREQYGGLRKWLEQFQEGISTSKTRKELEYQKTLDGISLHLDSLSKSAPAGNTSFSFGLGPLKMNLKTNLVENVIQKRFGMRAETTNLMLAPSDLDAVDKFLGMLGENTSKRGQEFRQALRKRASNSNPLN